MWHPAIRMIEVRDAHSKIRLRKRRPYHLVMAREPPIPHDGDVEHRLRTCEDAKPAGAHDEWRSMGREPSKCRVQAVEVILLGNEIANMRVGNQLAHSLDPTRLLKLVP